MRTRLGTVLSIVAAAAALAAQEPPPGREQQPTFRAGANYVRVDMYAMQDGQPVQDIRREEIEVLEDGVPQAIEDFEHVLVPGRTPLAVRREPDGLRESREAAADPRARVFVIFLDTYHTQAEGSANVRKPLLNFLDRVLGPDDLVALMTPEMAGSDIAFGRKTTVISTLISDTWWGKRARIVEDEQEMRYRACAAAYRLQQDAADGWAAEMISRRREKLTLDAFEDLMVHLAGLRDERKAVLVVTEGWLLHQPNERLANPNGQARPAGPFAVPTSPGRPAPATLTVSDPTLEADCEQDRIQLAMVDHDRRFREIANEANRGNVTFYPVHARGLVAMDAPMGPDQSSADPLADARNLRTRVENMRTLAVETDGTAIVNTNDLDGGLKRIADDLSSYYLLGYYSTNTKLDGRFRSITVRVKRPGVRVRARRGYRGRTAEELVSSTVAAPDLGREAVAAALNTVAGINARSSFRIRPAAWAMADGNSVAGAVWVVGELDYQTRKELAWTAGAEADVAVVAADGSQVLSASIDVPAAAQGIFSVRIPETGFLKPGEYALRVRLTPESGSSLEVTDTVRMIVPDRAAALGEAILWRRGPSTGPQYLRTADPRFQRSERIRLEMATNADGTATARMLDRAGKPLQVPVTVTRRTDAAAATTWIVADATLAPLAPGDYAIEVTLGGTMQVIGFRVVP